MRQFIYGALSGAAITTLLLTIFSGGAEDGISPVASAKDTTDSLARPHAELHRQPKNPTESPNQSDQKSSSTTLAASGARAQVDAKATPPAQTIRSEGTLPIRLSSEHAAVLTPSNPTGRQLTLPELHAVLSLEQKDPSWSWKTEQLLAQYFAQRNTTGEFEILAVECRTTLCEVLAFGNLPTSSQRWAQIVGEIANQPWWTNFHTSTTNLTEKHGRGALVTIFQRARQ